MASVEPDSIDRIQSDLYRQDGAPWGVARISHKRNTYNTTSQQEYIFLKPAGNDTSIYVIGSGVMENHVELQGRVRCGRISLMTRMSTKE